MDDYLRYLDAQRSTFSNQTTLIQISTERQIALVDLFRSLGGGWGQTEPMAGIGALVSKARSPASEDRTLAPSPVSYWSSTGKSSDREKRLPDDWQAYGLLVAAADGSKKSCNKSL